MGLQPRSQDLSLGFCSEAKGEVLGTGPVGGLREVFCFPFLFGMEARD